MSRYLTWLRKYEGKKVEKDLWALTLEDADLDWVATGGDGFGTVETNLRPYKPMSVYDSDNWSVVTGLSFTTDQEGRLHDIRITARVMGDDGLGDVDPEDIWNMDDYRHAKEFLESITGIN